MRPRLLAMVLSFNVIVSGVGAALADPPGHSGAGPADGGPRVAWWAVPSDTGHYLGYYVGGGCGRPLKGEQRRADEGTWGWDYQGWLVPRRVMLQWWHGRRSQGGTGAYNTEGPKLYRPEENAK
jgi:hypothetical protein